MALLVAACGAGDEAANSSAQGKGGAGGPVAVGFVVVQPTSVASTTELPGRTAAFETSEVRPQVTGIIRRRLFTEGAMVRAGQTLYQIDPSLYQASANQAQANLSSAAATAEAARIRADRYRPLAQAEAVSKQDYTDAVATQRQAEASIAQNRAALETARINLNFTRVPAPITGRIGRSLATVGALVSSNQADPMAVIQRTDPMFVDIQQSSANLLALRRSLQQGDVAPASANVRLKLEDGSDYGFAGTVQFAEVTVDQATGTVTLRASFPNPQGLLLPGMFVRATFAQSVNQNAFLVPQPAVARDARGAATVYVVGPDNKAVQRQIVAERAQGAFWVVTQGLNPGDKVIVQGTAKLKPNAAIRPVPANTPQKVQAPSGKAQPGGGATRSGG
ncbi:efflux RND transporter periplasmic adaptor subunit [Sphingomonas donggukensis]|uniref:Efflux RND transporter periplasmic adaptor subunit n=1 Tax=Sphingomonas donggukensis TaxID=2949093 RepID=A0ABY4U0Q9_9SPHN|nr:efflux RND transporter periplasmic adaptor subunit [Sphingomonas donggukensis]URW76954.1 efflux RND transporter periplasmic adaptor subunit [Sphingomonas donggukensis]